MKRRNPVTGKIERVRYPRPPRAPIYRMWKRMATQVKGRTDDGDEGFRLRDVPPPPS